MGNYLDVHEGRAAVSGIMEMGSHTTWPNKIAISNAAPRQRPKLLFLAYPFPPSKGPACVRTWNIAMHLARLGWDVTVVTPDPAILRSVEGDGKISAGLEREGIKRVLTGHSWRCLLPRSLKCWNKNIGRLAGGVCRTIALGLGIELYVGWVKAVEQASSTLCPKDVDVILATGGPFVAFRLARSLSDQLGRPYVLDYRDPWTANPHHDRPPRLATIREEGRLLQGCAAVTVVSPSWGMDLDRRFSVGAKLHVVTNGYDSSEMAAVKPHDFGHCAFVYTGIFYPPKRTISPFFAALKLLRESPRRTTKDWYFHYYGVDEKHVREQADRFGLSDRIILHGRVPREQALSAVKGANLSIVITSVAEEKTLEDNGIVTGKIFEAIGLATPVLLIAPIGSDASALTASTGLVKSFGGSEIQGMASFLEDLVQGRDHQPKSTELFSWTTISKNLDTLLREVVACDSSHVYM